ncbi:hypothetical protein A5875_004427 [Enterococcus sp. 3H8_DIV0648]|nr:hypothetical protein A5875_004427 [Enterococcus sp. 3H8_DIV0648]
MSKEGDYDVELTTSDGQKKTVQVHVLKNHTAVNVHDSTIYVGDKWEAKDNFDSAVDKDGQDVDLKDIIVNDSQKNTEQVGSFDVTYTYEGITSTAKVTVKENQASINVHDSTIYVGDKWEAKDNFDSAIAKDGHKLSFNELKVDDHEKNTSKKGSFKVTYSYEGITSTSTITVKEKPINSQEKYKVVVQYLDEDGNKISDSVTLTGKEGEAYHTEAKKIKGYTLTKEPKNKEGKFTKDSQSVTYVYARKESGNEDAIETTGRSENHSGNSRNKPIPSSTKSYPKTGEETNNLLSAIGVALLVLISGVLIFLKRKKNETND